MPYVGGSLVTWFDAGPQAITRETGRKMADKGGRRMTEVAKLNTPVRTGHLRESMKHKHATRKGDIGYESGVYTDVSYAPFVEYGTGLWGPSHAKYVIEPKDPGGMLHWIDPRTGQSVYARRVFHPGSPGNHMIAIAAAVVEHEASGGHLFRPELAEWAQAVARSGK